MDTHTESTATALVPVKERAAIALGSSQTEIDLKALVEKHRELTAITNKDGREQVHGAMMELKRSRTAIEHIAKNARDDANKFANAVIAEEKRLIGIIDPEEKRLAALRNAWDAEQERIKAEKAAAEKARVEAIQARIARIAAAPAAVAGSNSDHITKVIAGLEQTAIDESFAEFAGLADGTKASVLHKLGELKAAAVAREAEQARLEAEREAERQRVAAEQEALRKSQEQLEAQRKELERVAAEQRQVAEEQARVAAEQARVAAEQEAKAKAEANKGLIDRIAEAVKPQATPALAPAAATPTAPEAAQAKVVSMAPAADPVAERTKEIVDLVATCFQVDRATAIEYIHVASDALRAEDGSQHKQAA